MAKVAVIGSGFVGRAWAISFARAGCEVAIWDQDKEAPGKALAYIERLLPDLEASDLLERGRRRARSLRRSMRRHHSNPRLRARSTSRRTRRKMSR